MFANQGLSDATVFLGHLDDVTTFYAASDVVVLTSPQRSIEGSPNALLEAMSMSRPIVATRVGGIPELVRHGQDGFLNDPTDVHGFAANVVRLLRDPTLRQEMGESGRARVIESFDTEKIAMQLAVMLRTFGAPWRSPEPSPLAAGMLGQVLR